MSAMEKMVASMLGITPDQMQEMLTGFQTLLKDLAGKLETIEANGKANGEVLAAILAKLEASDERRTGSGGASRDGKRGRGSNENIGGASTNGTGDGSGAD